METCGHFSREESEAKYQKCGKYFESLSADLEVASLIASAIKFLRGDCCLLGTNWQVVLEIILNACSLLPTPLDHMFTLQFCPFGTLKMALSQGFEVLPSKSISNKTALKKRCSFHHWKMCQFFEYSLELYAYYCPACSRFLMKKSL